MELLPADHPARVLLSNEGHARPPEALVPPVRISYIVLLGDEDLEPLNDLCERYGADRPAVDARHFSADFGPFRLRYERHSEFSRYMFVAQSTGRNLFEKTALDDVPADWLELLSGALMIATHVEFVDQDETAMDEDVIANKYFSGNALVGSKIAGGKGRAFTDFRIHVGGFSRVLIEDLGMTPRQRGRFVQRLLEIDTYRLLALLAFPLARDLLPFLSTREDQLTGIANAMLQVKVEDEPKLLERLTELHAEVVRTHAESNFRFSAAAAYSALVARRIKELREQRIEGLQTFEEFTQRRLAPAMETCASTSRRLDELSNQVARAMQLLSTRVDLTRERQNQALLESMDRRARLQLRLQKTVEGLSIAAITYYVVGLVGYAFNGLQASGFTFVDPAVAVAVSIPIVAAIAAIAVVRVRASIEKHDT